MMTIRTILAAASGGSATEGTLELACRLARAFNAHVEGFHAINDPRDVFVAAGSDVPIFAPEILDQLRQEAETTANRTRAVFDTVTRRNGIQHRAAPAPAIPAPSAGWREDTGYAPSLVARRARFFDLAVLGRSERVVDETHTRTIEETLEAAGRPILLAPAECPTTTGERIALAWNGSPESVHAVAAGLPFLARAKSVTVIVIGEVDEAGGLPALIDYLSWHGVRASPIALARPADRSVGEALLNAANGANADLLVMGGFGRRPWREALFGGATRDVLSLKTIPLLLAH
jgi:nucleotide-binding universal stress UspA family protein